MGNAWNKKETIAEVKSNTIWPMSKTQDIIVGVKANRRCLILRTKKSSWQKLKPSQNGKSFKKCIIVKVFCDFLEICENIMRRKLRNDKFVELTICQGFPMRKDEISKK